MRLGVAMARSDGQRSPPSVDDFCRCGRGARARRATSSCDLHTEKGSLMPRARSIPLGKSLEYRRARREVAYGVQTLNLAKDDRFQIVSARLDAGAGADAVGNEQSRADHDNRSWAEPVICARYSDDSENFVLVASIAKTPKHPLPVFQYRRRSAASTHGDRRGGRMR